MALQAAKNATPKSAPANDFVWTETYTKGKWPIDSALVTKLLVARSEAKQKKDYPSADKLALQLQSMRVAYDDSTYTWHVKGPAQTEPGTKSEGGSKKRSGQDTPMDTPAPKKRATDATANQSSAGPTSVTKASAAVANASATPSSQGKKTAVKEAAAAEGVAGTPLDKKAAASAATPSAGGKKAVSKESVAGAATPGKKAAVEAAAAGAATPGKKGSKEEAVSAATATPGKKTAVVQEALAATATSAKKKSETPAGKSAAPAAEEEASSDTTASAKKRGKAK